MNEEWRRRRIAKNETMFRDINERLEQGLKQVRHHEGRQQFVCECGNRDCDMLVTLTFEEYERVRRDSRHYAVVPGHVFPDTERVIAGNDRFEVVEKVGEPGVQISDAADQRAPGDSGLRDG